MATEAAYLEQRSYHEAGHAVMSYLIHKGFSEEFVPLDHSLILPSFECVAIEGKGADWGEFTGSIGSLITVSQVLLAGRVAEKIKYGLPKETLPSQDQGIRLAWHLTARYVEELYRLEPKERDNEASKLLRQLFTYVNAILNKYGG